MDQRQHVNSQREQSGRRGGGFQAFFSVFHLMAAGSFRKICLLMVLSAALYGFLGYIELRDLSDVQGTDVLGSTEHLSTVFIWILVFAVHFIATGSEGKGSMSGYTWSRLRLSRGQLLACEAVYTFLVFALLWLWQIVLMTALCSYGATLVPAPFDGQYLFVKVFTDEYFMTLLPLYQPMKMFTNALGLACLSMVVAWLNLARVENKRRDAAAMMATLGYGWGFIEADVDLGSGVAAVLVILILAALFARRSGETDSSSEVAEPEGGV